MTLRIAWFATAKGTSSRKLLKAAQTAIEDDRLDAEIVCVVCNREPGQSANTDAFLDDAVRAGIPIIASSSGEWRKRVRGAISDPTAGLAPWRREFDQHLYERMQEHAPDLGMLAGYMLVVTDVICDHLPCLNLHPALPDGPIGTWQQVIHELIRNRAERSGMVLQRVTTKLDRGPTVTWAQYSIQAPEFEPLWEAHRDDPDSETPLFHAIREAGVSREPTFILQSLQAIAGGTAQMPAPDADDAGAEITAQVEEAIRHG